MGLIDYQSALTLQQSYWKEIQSTKKSYLLLLQHPPVITTGRRTAPDHLLLNKAELKQKGVDLISVDRGGSATYHGPGQLVGYVICKSARYGGIYNLVSMILSAINNSIQQLGIECKIDTDNPGVWTDTSPPRKLAAVGMSNKDGYTMHGFAININMPLTGFSFIVPCGLSEPVSTLSIEKGDLIDIGDFTEIVIDTLLDKLVRFSKSV